MGMHEHGVCSAILHVLLQYQARGGMSSDGLFRMGGGYYPGKRPITIANISVLKTQCPMVHVNLGSVEPGTCSRGVWFQLQLIARLYGR